MTHTLDEALCKRLSLYFDPAALLDAMNKLDKVHGLLRETPSESRLLVIRYWLSKLHEILDETINNTAIHPEAGDLRTIVLKVEAMLVEITDYFSATHGQLQRLLALTCEQKASE